MASQTCDHRRWVTGTIDSAATWRERRVEDLLRPERGADREPGRARAAHAERIPGAHRLERRLVAVGQDEDLVVRLGVRTAPQGRQEVVGVGAVRHGRRPLLEREAARSLGVTAAIDRPRSPPVPISDVTDAISRGSSTSPRRYSAKNEPGVAWRAIVTTWIWCIAKTIAVAPQARPSS